MLEGQKVGSEKERIHRRGAEKRRNKERIEIEARLSTRVLERQARLSIGMVGREPGLKFRTITLRPLRLCGENYLWEKRSSTLLR